jgi:hypothetical protein
MKASFGALAIALGLVCGAAPNAARAQTITINPIFSSTCEVCGFNPSEYVSLQSIPGAAAAATAAAQQVASQFSGNLTVNIAFVGVHAGTGSNSFLSMSEPGWTVYTYGQYTSALAADAAANPSNTILNTAVANLLSGNGANDPSALVAVTTPDARLLGLNLGVPVASGFGSGTSTPQYDAAGDWLQGNGTVDGIVLLNLDYQNAYSRPLPGLSSGVFFDAEGDMEHEIDEVLGIGGGGSQVATDAYFPNYSQSFFGVNGAVYGPMDLYRYQAPGVPSFDPSTTSITGCAAGEDPFDVGVPCSGLSSPYFSVDGGVTSIVPFNQAFPAIGGDSGDWAIDPGVTCPEGDPSGYGDVQDAFGCSNLAEDVKPGTPSYEALEAIGYNPTGVPEPATWAMSVLGLATVGFVLRRRREGEFVPA